MDEYVRKEPETLFDQLDQTPTTVPTADRSTWLHNDIPLILNIQPALYHYRYIYCHWLVSAGLSGHHTGHEDEIIFTIIISRISICSNVIMGDIGFATQQKNVFDNGTLQIIRYY